MSRKEAIDWLCRLRSWIVIYIPRNKQQCKQALDFAISSLETDEAYQLEYERTTKNDLGVDCISRQDVLSEIIRFSTEEGASVECQQLYCDVNNMPSVTPQEPRWIPVSERLPNLDDFTGSKVWQKKVLITGYLSFDDTKDLFVSEAFAKDVICNSVHDTVVIAWMPLPQTYKE